MLDLFRQLKLEYKGYVLFIKSGNFYVSFDEDATVLNSIFNFKINELKNNIKVGFPISSLNIKILKLNELNVNYIVIENKEIVKIFSSDHNNYNKYCKSVFSIISINNKIDSICAYVKSIRDVELQKKIIKQIENILNEEK